MKISDRVSGKTILKPCALEFGGIIVRISARLGWDAQLARTALVVAAVLISMSLFPTGARASTITGILVYDSNSSNGGSMASGGWETPQVSGINAITMFQGGSTYGPGTFSLDISAAGTYDVSYTATTASIGGSYADLELFFDGSSSPGITAVINRSSQTTLIAPTSTSLYCLQSYTPCTANSGLVFVDGTNTITVSGFTLTQSPSSGVFGGDILLGDNAAVPEPASVGLVSAGFLAAGFLLARRSRNR